MNSRTKCYALLPKCTQNIAFNGICYDPSSKAKSIPTQVYVRRCYVCGQLGHKAYECFLYTGITMETYKKGEYIYGAEQMEEDKDGVKYKVTKKSVAVPPPAAKLPMPPPPSGGPARGPPGGPPPPPPPPMMMPVPKLAKKRVLSEKQKRKIEQEKKEMERRASVAAANSVVDEAAIQASMSSNSGANVEYKICKRTGKKVRLDQWESYSNSLSTEILPFLYLGGERNAHNHKELAYRTQCGFVLNLAWEVANFFPEEFEYFKLFLSDFSSSADELNSQIDNGIAFIDRARKANSSILVHCVQGISRSSTIVIAYLMKRENMTLKEAYSHVKSRRSIIRPNQGFLRCLMKLDEELHGKCSIVYEEYYPPDEKFAI